MNILITGSGGQLGQCFKKSIEGIKDTYFFKNKEELNILEYEQLDEFININNINVIINCAAYTDVDKAENDRDNCFKINVSGLENLIKLSLKYNIFLIQFSTDFIFNGNSNYPYHEEINPSPINFYGYTKLESEKVFFAYDLNGIIFRISWLYSSYGKNFYTNILDKLKKNNSFSMVFDQYSSQLTLFF